MTKLIRVLQFGGTVIAGIGCYMIPKNIMVAVAIAYIGLALIFTSIQIEERRKK